MLQQKLLATFSIMYNLLKQKLTINNKTDIRFNLPLRYKC